MTQAATHFSYALPTVSTQKVALVAPTVSHEEIALTFVRHYFTLMHNDISLVHRLYGKTSQFVCAMEGEASTVLVGDQAINKKLLELDVGGCNVAVSSIDSMFSVENCVLVKTMGRLYMRNNTCLKFSQTVLLAPQPTGYYILQEVFRYLKDETVEAKATGPVAKASEVTVTEKAAPSLPLEDRSYCAKVC